VNEESSEFEDMIWDPSVERSFFSLSRSEIHRKREIKRTAQKDEYLAQFAVDWLSPPADATRALEETLALPNHSEHDLQKVIAEHPLLLAKSLSGGHKRWVIPQVQLGNQFCTDFLIAQASSIGIEWVAVEIEPSQYPIATKSGNPSHQLSHAIRQIFDWRNWVSDNRDYASRPKTNNGLGLVDIEGDFGAVVIIGRREGLTPSANQLRKRFLKENRIAIRTYDWLIS
jgi:hypothetical protein